MEEFALCWNNFSENIANGFQNLLDRGNLLVDCTLACEGKLIHCHKLILAICSPYFQEMFVTNPCKHPIIILKDVSYGIMEELLQFMYQGEVNVKQSELQQFMKIAETLQIKGLTTSSSSSSTTPSNNKTPDYSSNQRNQQATSSPSQEHKSNPGTQKRSNEDPSPRKDPKSKRPNVDESEFNADSINEMASEEVFLPQISMIESRFDINSIKRESDNDGHSAHHPPSPTTMIRNSYANSGPPQNNPGPQPHPNFNFEFPNELHSQNDYNKSATSGYIDPIQGASITMLSSTSLLHGNCIFNRNNTVATQQGMKTYWLCKSYRITMCRARCITHQGRVISATGVHNHPPHMNMKSHEMQNSQGGAPSHNNSSQSPPQNPYSQQPPNIPMPPVPSQHPLHHPGGPPPQLMHYPHFPHHLSHHQQMAMNPQLLQEMNMNAPPSLQITPVVNMNPTGQNSEMQLLRMQQQHHHHQQQQQHLQQQQQQNLQNQQQSQQPAQQQQSPPNVPGSDICNPSPHSNQSHSPKSTNNQTNENVPQQNSNSIQQQQPPDSLLESLESSESPLQTSFKLEHSL